MLLFCFSKPTVAQKPKVGALPQGQKHTGVVTGNAGEKYRCTGEQSLVAPIVVCETIGVTGLYTVNATCSFPID